MPNTNFRNSNDFSGENFYVGIDVHKKPWSVTVRAFEQGVAHFTQPPVAEALASTLHKKRCAKFLMEKACPAAQKASWGRQNQ